MAGNEPIAALTVFTMVRRLATTTDCGSPSVVSTSIVGTRSPWVNPTARSWEMSRSAWATGLWLGSKNRYAPGVTPAADAPRQLLPNWPSGDAAPSAARI